MKTLILVLALALAYSAFGVTNYVMVGGAGTRANANDLNGGAYRGSQTWASAQGTNGGNLLALTNVALTNNGSGKCRITSTGSFTGSYVDLRAYCAFSGTYTNGSYWILAQTADYIDIDLTYSADVTVTTCNIGGALATIQAPWSKSVVEAQTTVKISGGPYSTATGNYILEATFATPGADGYAKAANTITIQGVCSDGVFNKDSLITINATGVSYGIGEQSYHKIMGFKITNALLGGISGANGVSSPAQIHVAFCEVTGMSSAAQGVAGIYIKNYGSVEYCYVHDNTAIGISMGGGAFVYGCKTRNNTKGEVKINFGVVSDCEISNYTSACNLILADEQNPQQFQFLRTVLDGGNVAGTVGLRIGSVVSQSNGFGLHGVSFVNCDTGIVSKNVTDASSLICSNLYYNNNVDVSTNGNVTKGLYFVTGNPNFKDAANGDYRLNSGSAAIKAALTPRWMLE